MAGPKNLHKWPKTLHIWPKNLHKFACLLRLPSAAQREVNKTPPSFIRVGCWQTDSCFDICSRNGLQIYMLIPSCVGLAMMSQIPYLLCLKFLLHFQLYRAQVEIILFGLSGVIMIVL